jgi:hypothetical protein
VAVRSSEGLGSSNGGKRTGASRPPDLAGVGEHDTACKRDMTLAQARKLRNGLTAEDAVERWPPMPACRPQTSEAATALRDGTLGKKRMTPRRLPRSLSVVAPTDADAPSVWVTPPRFGATRN